MIVSHPCSGPEVLVAVADSPTALDAAAPPGARRLPQGFSYHPALDGLRGVAILAVMVYHSGFIRGGFLGVDVFFTLSGFLITALLLRERATTGRIGIGQFYVRRGLRLLPALVVFLAVWAGVLLATVAPEYWWLVGSYAVAVLFYVGNWAGIAGLPMGLFGHVWSLAIEEQFYLVWPFVTAAVTWGRARGLVTAGLLASVAVLSVVWRAALAMGGASERRIYWATDAHADGLLIGAALAFAIVGAPQSAGWRLGNAGGSVAAVALVSVLVFGSVAWYAYGLTVVAALATAAVIVAALAPASALRRVLEARWLVGTGRLSYALYLWHFPVFFQLGALKYPGDIAPPVRTLLAWALAFVAAIGSYALIERPALAYKDRFRGTRADS